MEAPCPVGAMRLHTPESKQRDNTTRTIPAALTRFCRKWKYASYHSLGFSARDVVELLPAAIDANEEGMFECRGEAVGFAGGSRFRASD
jgi:hypothetical protein